MIIQTKPIRTGGGWMYEVVSGAKWWSVYFTDDDPDDFHIVSDAGRGLKRGSRTYARVAGVVAAWRERHPVSPE